MNVSIFLVSDLIGGQLTTGHEKNLKIFPHPIYVGASRVVISSCMGWRLISSKRLHKKVCFAGKTESDCQWSDHSSKQRMVSSSAALESGIRDFHAADANAKFVQRADHWFIWGSVCSLIISMAF